ncbi:MAG: hypothetical protein DWQ10_06860, partial [Calditrichaeota bacterium]
MSSDKNRITKISRMLFTGLATACLLLTTNLSAQSISVNPGNLSLGTQNTANFVVTSAIPVTFNTGSWSNYTLRVFTQNSDGKPGLAGQTDPSVKLPFKVWTANQGPSTTMPDPVVAPNWVDWWNWVLDRAEMVSDNRYTWRRLTWVGPNDDSSVGSPFDVYFAFDLEKNGYTHQAYSGTVYFELIDKYSDDTGAQTVAATFTMDISLDFGLTASLSLDPSSLTLNSMMVTTDTRTLVSGVLFASVKATGLRSYNPAWDCNAVTIRAYTDNSRGDTTQIKHGLVGQTNSVQSVPVKVWTPNFGAGIDNDSDGIPDIDNDLNWKSDSAAVWVYAFDKNLPLRENSPWNYPLFDYTDLIRMSNLHSDPEQQVPPGFIMQNPKRDGSDGRIPIHFSFVLDAKASPQIYKSDIYVELGISADYGATHMSWLDSLQLTLDLQDARPLITLASDKNILSFPTLTTFQQRTLAEGHVELSLDARGLYKYDAIALRLLTDNGADANGHVRMGMKGNIRPDWTVLLRAWTLNYGLGDDEDQDGIADIDSEDNWRGGDSKTVWVNISDKAEPVREDWSHITDPNDPFYDGENAWGRTLFDFNELYRWSDYHHRKDQYGDYVYHVPQHLRLIDRTPNEGANNTVDLYFAADFTDAFPQDYSTTVLIEAVFSEDGGYTIARKESLTVDISASVPAGTGDGLDWLKNRIDMRPDLDGDAGNVKKLGDSQQDENDIADSAFLYDQALLIMQLTRAGDFTRAQQIMNAMEYVQNNDGSFFFSYMSLVTDDKIAEWVITDNDGNGKLDELEKRVNWAAEHGLDSTKQQLRSWAYTDYRTTICPQTETTLPHHILYRTTDFRKFAGSNAWFAMALIYYEKMTGDSQYRPMIDALIGYMKSIQQTSQATSLDSIDYGGIRLGRSFFSWTGAGYQGFDGPAVDNFVNLRAYSIEHNMDTYSAFRYYADLTGDSDTKDRADLIKDFILRQMWAPNVDLAVYPEAADAVENCFFVGLDLTSGALGQNPNGLVDEAHYLDAQSWAVLAFGADMPVDDKNGNPGDLRLALDFLDATDSRTWLDFNDNSIPARPYLKVTGSTIYAGTGSQVAGIDGYKEHARDRYYQTANNLRGDFVWSEGSEGVVSARYIAGDTTVADYYHGETASYTLSNGGVPYSTLALIDSAAYIGKENWSFGDNASVAGTAWYLFNEAVGNGALLNPFQPWVLPAEPVFEDDFQGYDVGDWPDSGVWTALKAGAWFWAAVSDAGSTWMKGFSGGEQLLEIDG